MMRKTARGVRRASVSGADFARLKRDLATCSPEVERFSRARALHIHRMRAVQAEIDRLRAVLRL
jgi:hypothetical protein